MYRLLKSAHHGHIDIDTGTIQGSVLGLILFALFATPLFDICQLTNFADDNFTNTMF